MTNIELGDPFGLLQRGPAELNDPSNWTKRDSDIIAHYLQVNTQLRSSSWYAADKKFSGQGSKTIEVSMPDLEQFVFAAVYFRQLTMQKDSLLQDATDRYCSHVACSIRRSWIRNEADSFKRHLDSQPFLLENKKFTFRQLFDAFMYGASLIHKIPDEHDAKRKRFLDVYDNHPRAQLLFSLNMGMHTSLSYVGNVAIIIDQDFAHWQNTHSLPPPDVRWHSRLFDVPVET